MGKAGNWIRRILAGKKEKVRERGKKDAGSGNYQLIDNKIPTPPSLGLSTPPATPKEKRRWSFRRSSSSSPSPAKKEAVVSTDAGAVVIHSPTKQENHEQKSRTLALATAAAADAAVVAAQAAAVVIALTSSANGRLAAGALEDTAAVKIQTVFRGFLARKALNALKGLVKLQALVRGHLVRRQATVTLRCMQALVAAQNRARTQRLRISEETTKPNNHKQMPHRKSTQENTRSTHFHHELDSETEEKIKIVEMDIGEAKWSKTNRNINYMTNQAQTEQTKPRSSTNSTPNCEYLKKDYNQQHISPAPSAVTDMSPRPYSLYFEDCSFSTAQSSPQCHSAMSRPDSSGLQFVYPWEEYAESLPCENPFYPNYMANTESSRAKVRSQSAPKSRPESFERVPSRRRPSIEGRNIPRAVRMQRSSSQIAFSAQNYQYPLSIKLDKSTVSIKDSECASTSTVLTNTNYCRSLVGFEVSGK